MATEFTDHLKTFNQFLSKSDGKDKLCATIQYVCLFLSAGNPGQIRRIQASVAAARKPLESMTPLLITPGFDPSASRLVQLIKKASTFESGPENFDHVVWMGQIELITNTRLLKTSQKLSLSCWFVGSLCTIATQCIVLAEKLPEINEDALPNEKARVRREINSQLLILIHACLQALLALGLLGYAPFKMRQLGLIGTLASALNCYLLYPSTRPNEKEKRS